MTSESPQPLVDDGREPMHLRITRGASDTVAESADLHLDRHVHRHRRYASTPEPAWKSPHRRRRLRILAGLGARHSPRNIRLAQQAPPSPRRPSPADGAPPLPHQALVTGSARGRTTPLDVSPPETAATHFARAFAAL